MYRLMFYFGAYGVLLAVLFHFIPGKIFLFLILLFFLYGFILVRREYRESIRALKEESNSRLENYNSEKKRLEKEISDESGRVSELRTRELMMVRLYEITRKMSQDLTFNDIFGALSAFLKEYFVFKKSELLVLKEADGYIKIDRAYKLYKEEKEKKDEPETDYGDILMLFNKDKKEAYISDEGKDSFGAIPLLSENKLVGILTVEGLPRADFERLIIVATQFALEIKKVFLYETVENLAITDSLTGLYTRRYFFERLNEEITRSRKHGFKFAFLMIDIDDFKKCNDGHGHLVGDIVLKDVSRLIKESVREIDLVARYGGEEFSVILPETDKKGAFTVAERIRKKIEENIFNAYDEKVRVTISAGLAVYSEAVPDLGDIIERADKALYEAKNSGKNIVCEYKD